MTEKHLTSPSSLSHLSGTSRQFPPKKNERSHIENLQHYLTLYQRSIHDEKNFWLEQAATLEWITFPQQACEYQWNTAQSFIEHSWFKDGKLNVCYNCVDRHLETCGEKIAFIWQGEEETDVRSLTYIQLHQEVCRLANALKTYGVQKGDRVCIYMPMIIEGAVAMLACARIGAIHSVVFAGFSSDSLAHRLQDSGSKVLITANMSIRGGKNIALKELADAALLLAPNVSTVLVYERTKAFCPMTIGRDHWYHEACAGQPVECPCESLSAEDPLFILYTSGSTGKPKGVVHTQGGYLLHASLTHKYVFDLQPDDLYWCTADLGWVTGHSYIVYGPLCNAATSLLFEGTPLFPDAGRYWQVIQKHRPTIFYTAPTAIRTLIAKGDDFPHQYDLSSLRTLGSVGEPINPEAWMWFYEKIGHQNCPIMDTWWQTETGGIMISPMPSSHTLKPGSANRPFFGVEPIVLKDDGTPCQTNEGGSLCIKKPWPGMMRTTWGDHERFIKTYFSTFPDVYFSGDGCRIDEDGDYWLLGRIDDVVNISGHRIGTAEVESALVSHPAVAESAVVPIPDEIKGQGLYVFITLIEGTWPSSLREDIIIHIRKEIGPIAVPNHIQFAAALPKTRSGKIMRRVLRKIAEGQWDKLGDISTLAEPDVIQDLIKGLP